MINKRKQIFFLQKNIKMESKINKNEGLEC